MRPLLRIAAHLVFACGMFVYWVLPSNKYDWMQDFDPSISVESIKDPSGNRVLFTFVVLVLMVLLQAALIMKSQSTREKLVSGTLILAAVVVWVAKFWL